MGNRLELTGQKFGRLTVIGFHGVKKGNTYWDCKCDCGVEKAVHGSRLKGGTTTSCGCAKTIIEPKGGL